MHLFRLEYRRGTLTRSARDNERVTDGTDFGRGSDVLEGLILVFPVTKHAFPVDNSHEFYSFYIVLLFFGLF